MKKTKIDTQVEKDDDDDDNDGEKNKGPGKAKNRLAVLGVTDFRRSKFFTVHSQICALKSPNTALTLMINIRTSTGSCGNFSNFNDGLRPKVYILRKHAGQHPPV